MSAFWTVVVDYLLLHVQVVRVNSTSAAISYERQSNDCELKLKDNSENSKYELYKAQVARIMGANPETFTEKDLKVS